MKKILSLVLTVLMLVGTFTIGASAGEETNKQVLKFDDTTFKEGGGNVGMGTIDVKKYFMGEEEGNKDKVIYDYINKGYTVSMDFVFGREGGPCFHPTDTALKHTSKFAVCLGNSEGTSKYVGYSATEDRFFLAECANGPFYGEGADGLEFFVDAYDPEHYSYSEQGLVQPGVTYRLDLEFVDNTGFNLYLDGKCIISFDLYEHLDYTTYFAHEYFLMYPTHITCAIDNVAVYKAGVFDPATGEGIDDYELFYDFEDAKMEEKEIKNDAGEVTGTEYTVTVDDYWSLTEAYTLVDPANDIYCQPQYVPEEGQANIIFQSGLNKRANGIEELFSSGMDFKINVTMANNPGFDTINLDLVNDNLITVKEVAAADGLTAKLDGSKLTITGDNYTGEAIATVTYNIAKEAVQGYFYRYGAKVDTVSVKNSAGDVDVVLTNGISELYNYTLGDMNDDGKYNLSDVTVLLKVLAKWDMPGVFKEAGDVRLDDKGIRDGRTNNMDASYYLRWLAHWPGYTIGGITRY